MADTSAGHSPPDPQDPGGDPDIPAIEDTAGLGGWVWIVLFGGVMVLSILANILLTSCVLADRKKHSVVYFLLILMFAINLVDYALLVFEFSLGMGHEYPYGSEACTLYQVSVRGNPILQAATVLVMLHYASSLYCNLESRPVMNRNDTTVTCSRTNSLMVFFSALTGLLVAEALFSVPTACFATIVTVDDKNYCEIDLASIAPTGGHQQAISIFYLLYSAVFSYWLPLMIAIQPMFKLYRSANSDKYPEVSVVLSTASSFFVFFLLHGSVVFARHILDASGIPLSTYQSWMIKVAQSLLWLVAYFWHFTRPALALLLDPDLKQELARWFGASGTNYSSIDLPVQQNNRLIVPMNTFSVTTGSTKDIEKCDTTDENSALSEQALLDTERH